MCVCVCFLDIFVECVCVCVCVFDIFEFLVSNRPQICSNLSQIDIKVASNWSKIGLKLLKQLIPNELKLASNWFQAMSNWPQIYSNGLACTYAIRHAF